MFYSVLLIYGVHKTKTMNENGLSLCQQIAHAGLFYEDDFVACNISGDPFSENRVLTCVGLTTWSNLFWTCLDIVVGF